MIRRNTKDKLLLVICGAFFLVALSFYTNKRRWFGDVLLTNHEDLGRRQLKSQLYEDYLFADDYEKDYSFAAANPFDPSISEIGPEKALPDLLADFESDRENRKGMPTVLNATDVVKSNETETHSLYTDPQKVAKRLGRISRLCKKYNLKEKPWKHKGQLFHFIVDDKHRTLYCSIPKVGCTSWKYFFINLTSGGATERLGNVTDHVAHPWVHKYARQNLTTLDQYSVKEIKYRLKNYFKFLVVRHPFQRLYATYRDKILKTETGTGEMADAKFYDKWAPEIRKITQNSTELSPLPIPFSAFVDYLIQTDPNDYNLHWATYSRLCHPCSIKYDYVAKYRTLETDTKYILRQMNVTGVSVPHLHTHTTANDITIASRYRELDPETVKKLFAIYIKDFRLFGYPSSMFFRND